MENHKIYKFSIECIQNLLLSNLEHLEVLKCTAKHKKWQIDGNEISVVKYFRPLTVYFL